MGGELQPAAVRQPAGARRRRRPARRHGPGPGHAELRVPGAWPRCAAAAPTPSASGASAAAAQARPRRRRRRRHRRTRELTWDDVRRWTCWAWKSATAWCRWSTRRRAAICSAACAACAASSRRSSASWCRRCTSATTWTSRPTSIASTWAACRSARASSTRTASWPSIPGRVFGQVQGIATRDPAFGMEAVWIEPGRARSRAEHWATPWSTPSTVIATHLSHIIQSHAHELLGHEEVQQLLQHVAKSAPKLVEDLVPQVLPLATAGARAAGPAGRARADPQHARHRRDPGRARAALPGSGGAAGRVRIALGRQIVQDIAGIAAEVAGHDAGRRNWSDCCRARSAGQSPAPGLEPGLAERLQQPSGGGARARRSPGEPAVLLVPPPLRQTLARFMRASVPSLHVLAWNEIPDNRKVRLVSAVGR